MSLTGLANKLGSKGAQPKGLLDTQTCSLSKLIVPFGCCHAPRIRSRPPERPLQDFLRQVRLCCDVLAWPNLSRAGAETTPSQQPPFRWWGVGAGLAETRLCQQPETALPYPQLGQRGKRYHFGTISVMAMTLRLDAEHDDMVARLSK
jgi:hypothetical protein